MYSAFGPYNREWGERQLQGNHDNHPPPPFYPPHAMEHERHHYSINYSVEYSQPLNYYTEFHPPGFPLPPPQSPNLAHPPFNPLKTEGQEAQLCGMPPQEERVALVRPRRGGGRRPAKEETLSPEEEEKRAIRRQRNKLAAARCRKRRLDHTNSLLAQTQDLETHKLHLKDQIYSLAAQKKELEEILNSHKAVCRLEGETGAEPSGPTTYTENSQEAKWEGGSFYHAHPYPQGTYMETHAPLPQNDNFNSPQIEQHDNLKFNLG